MEKFTLSNQNPEFIIWGSEERMSVEILKIILKESLPGQLLELQVTDENEFLLYSKPLIPSHTDPDAVQFSPYPEVPVNKRFIFSAYIQVKILASNNSPFTVEMHYV